MKKLHGKKTITHMLNVFVITESVRCTLRTSTKFRLTRLQEHRDETKEKKRKKK